MCVKKCNTCGVVKALTEFNKDSALKTGRRGTCRDCTKAYNKGFYWDNHASERSRNAEYKRNNKDTINALVAKRRSAKLQRTVAWADLDAIKGFYKRAQILSEATGIPMEVDHVYPLQGELVSGLHVESNLQILPAAVNASKSNKFKVQ